MSSKKILLAFALIALVFYIPIPEMANAQITEAYSFQYFDVDSGETIQAVNMIKGTPNRLMVVTNNASNFFMYVIDTNSMDTVDKLNVAPVGNLTNPKVNDLVCSTTYCFIAFDGQSGNNGFVKQVSRVAGNVAYVFTEHGEWIAETFTRTIRPVCDGSSTSTWLNARVRSLAIDENGQFPYMITFTGTTSYIMRHITTGALHEHVSVCSGTDQRHTLTILPVTTDFSLPAGDPNANLEIARNANNHVLTFRSEFNGLAPPNNAQFLRVYNHNAGSIVCNTGATDGGRNTALSPIMIDKDNYRTNGKMWMAGASAGALKQWSNDCTFDRTYNSTIIGGGANAIYSMLPINQNFYDGLQRFAFVFANGGFAMNSYNKATGEIIENKWIDNFSPLTSLVPQVNTGSGMRLVHDSENTKIFYPETTRLVFIDYSEFAVLPSGGGGGGSTGNNPNLPALTIPDQGNTWACRIGIIEDCIPDPNDPDCDPDPTATGCQYIPSNSDIQTNGVGLLMNFLLMGALIAVVIGASHGKKLFQTANLALYAVVIIGSLGIGMQLGWHDGILFWVGVFSIVGLGATAIASKVGIIKTGGDSEE